MGRLSRLFGGFRSSKRSASEQDEQSRTPIEWIIAGLGNPGKEYAGSRHNTGFLVLDKVAENMHAEFGRRRFDGVTAEVEISSHRAILVKPQTYYNNSGDCA